MNSLESHASIVHQALSSATPPLQSEIDLERKLLNEYLTKHPGFERKLVEFTTHLKRNDWPSTLDAARETLELLFDFLTRPTTWDDPVLMLLSLRGLGRRLIIARPLELVVGCMVRRVLFLLREEISKIARQTKEMAYRERRKGNKTKTTTKQNNVIVNNKEAAPSTPTTTTATTNTVSPPATKTRQEATDDFESNESSEDQTGKEVEDEEDSGGEGDDSISKAAAAAAASKSKKKESKTVNQQKEDKNEEYEATGKFPSLQNILADNEADTSYFSLVATSPVHYHLLPPELTLGNLSGVGKGQKSIWTSLKKNMSQAVKELKGELDNVHDPIAKQALEYIHAREVVLVYGRSNGIIAFLKSANEKIPNFEVYVAETCDVHAGHEMAIHLSTLGIDTTVITDSAILALMARVNKVLIGARAVMANGGVLSDNGTNMVATAAKHHSVPLVCVTGLYKLCPLYPFNQDSFNDLISPGSFVSTSDIPLGDVGVDCPAFDYVSPDKVTLFITDNGAHQPSYIYRLLSEFYSPMDKLTEGVPQLDL